MLDAIIPDAWTHMLYMAAETVRDRTVFELREFQPTWMACALLFVRKDTNSSFQHVPFGKPKSNVTIAQTTHLFAVVVSTTYRYTTKGNVHIWPRRDTQVNCPVTSARYVMNSMRIIEITVFGMARRFETKVLKPMLRNVRVRYCLGVVIGVSKVRPIMYRGQRSKSQRLFQSNFGVIGCRLCMVPLLGSSRITRLTMIVSSLVDC